MKKQLMIFFGIFYHEPSPTNTNKRKDFRAKVRGKIMRFALATILCMSFLACEAMATLFHGPKPEGPPTYTVTFEPNGASGAAPAKRTVNPGAVIRLPTNEGLKFEGNWFIGWNESSTGVGLTFFNGDSITVTGDIILYAQWVIDTAVKYEVKLDPNGATNGTAPRLPPVVDGMAVTFPGPVDLVSSGKTFAGWNTESGGTGTHYNPGSSFIVRGNITLYAQWVSSGSVSSHTVAFNSGGGSYVPSQTVISGFTATVPAVPIRSGYAFENWYGNPGLTAIYDFSTPITGDISLFAKWNTVPQGSHIVTFNSNGGSNIPAQYITPGGTAARPANPNRSGYTFIGWYSDSGLNTVYNFSAPVTGNITLWAKWEPVTANSFTVTFESNGGNKVSGQIVSSGGTATRPADPTRNGYTFIDWYGDSGLNMVYDFSAPVTGNITVYAQWDVDIQIEPDIVVPEGGEIIHIGTQTALESIRDHIDDAAYNYGKNAYVLEQDITLSGTWTPIGYAQTVDSYGEPTGGIHAFSGNFYGNGHTIRNLVLPGGSTRFIGLFGYTDGALIQDVRVELGETTLSLTNSGSQMVGIITGGFKDSVIKNCGVYSLSGITVNGVNHYTVWFGGIAGRLSDGNYSVIENCYVSMNVTVTNGGTHVNASGIAFASDIIRNCYYIGNITTTCTYSWVHGVGASHQTVQMSYSAGTITNNAAGSGYTSASGIGWIWSDSSNGSMSNCVTLMERIDLPNITISTYRISTENTGLINNYAYSGMLLNGSTVTSSDPNSQNGLDKTAAELKQRSTYENGLGWDFDNVWEMGPASYPFPILKWQKGVIPLPQGFTVIGSRASVSANAGSPADFAAALTAAQNGPEETNFIVNVTADMSLGPQDLTLAAYKNKTVTLRGNTAARTISLSSNGSLFTVGADTELVLENIVLQGRENNNTSLVKVNKDGKLAVNGGGKVTGNTFVTSVNESGGGGVYMDGGVLEIAGGEVSGNTLSSSATQIGITGGGVYAANGSTVLMSGGTISDNHITHTHSSHGNSTGGGITIYNSSFEMVSGIIESNTVYNQSTNHDSYATGGGVYLSNGSSFYFKGGIIRSNTCNAVAGGMGIAYGGGIDCLDSDLVMSGGIISGNSCTSSSTPNSYNGQYIRGAYGGGMVLLGDCSLIKTGGIIYGNEVSGNDADGIPLKNTVQSNSGGLGGGHAVFYQKGTAATDMRRNTTAYATDNMDSGVSGAGGGWE